ncbi:rod-binding protein [Phenylobacterium sp.]|uniref:rod-binding protein n=1 Tax=Phenylobacterium sp. TaxID=1871053 RepID=UPI0035B1D924
MGPVSVSPALLQPVAAGASSAAELAKRGQIRETAEKFEAQFLSIMLQQMFEGVNVSAPFGGGPGEEMFKSFMSEAMAKQMTRAGGVGLTDQISREMLKLQGLS